MKREGEGDSVSLAEIGEGRSESAGARATAFVQRSEEGGDDEEGGSVRC